MARIFITGSADGLGSLAAQSLIDQGHQVVLHARNNERAGVAAQKVPRAETVLVADLSSVEETKQLAKEVNGLGEFDAVIHNAGVYQAPNEQIFSVNVLAPYILTSLIKPPKRLIYISSGMDKSGAVDLEHIDTDTGYSDSKLQLLLLMKTVARKWPLAYVNAVDPGWVPTKMGGGGASDDLQKGFETQVWLASSDDAAAKTSGGYYFHMQPDEYSSLVDDEGLQDSFITRCEELSGVAKKW